MKNPRVLISGASIAGPALACWLSRVGYECTVVERAPALRRGGHAVDFRGPAHLGALERLGLLGAVRERQTRPCGLTIVDAAGRARVSLPAAFTAGDVELERGELSQLLYEASRGRAEYLFGDQLSSLTEREGGVDVTFARGAPRSFDLVVGADGLHSGVRALAMGDESHFLRFHGYYVAGFTGPNLLGVSHASLLYSEPGRAVSVGPARRDDEATTLFVFASPPLDYDRRDLAAQKALLEQRYAGMSWQTPRLLEALAEAPELYFDSISQVDVPHFSRGRVALLGDAGYGGTIGGQGTGLALVCSYVLAGELLRSDGDHRAAFERYEALVRDYALGCQKGASRVGGFYAPTTRVGAWLRNTLYGALASRPLAGLLERIVRHSASDFALPDYPALSAS